MLATARLQTIVCTTNPEAAEHFYRDVLGLERKAGSDGAAVFDVGGADLRVSPVPALVPSEHTVLGFAVDDVDGVVTQLAARGITLVRFDHFPHAENGVVVTPDQSRVAWFRDPDGNLLSLVQYAVS